MRCAPTENHGSCIRHLRLDICFDEHNYHDSPQVRLVAGISHWGQSTEGPNWEPLMRQKMNGDKKRNVYLDIGAQWGLLEVSSMPATKLKKCLEHRNILHVS